MLKIQKIEEEQLRIYYSFLKIVLNYTHELTWINTYDEIKAKVI